MNLPDGRTARFSQLYVERGSAERDSHRMRNRLCAALISFPSYYLAKVPTLIYSELGISVPTSTRGTHWQDFFEQAKLRDILDSVTVASSLLRVNVSKFCDGYLQVINRIFKEENVGYRVDDAGVVHFAVDEEFAQNRMSVVAALTLPRYAGVAANVEGAFRHLDEVPPDGKLAVRAIFGALEGLFRLMFSNPSRLGSRQIEQYLKPALARVYQPGANQNAAMKFANSMKEWVEAAHFYRHEEGREEPAQPPLDLAIGLISTGTGLLRWLAELDQQLLKATTA